ncbi:MAG TPA: Rrf2 family transcriptional regulator [Rhodopila sp.]|jgi:Rrf2 family iron-sulfur cluster assembly transcriptional regulator|nr:Rrf2 family transcriptional regulator [Rhodopila sp.]
MQLSTRGRYAVMAMVDLAARQVADPDRGLICLADIAARQQLSQSYLEQLFGKLRRAGLVGSARGPGGGYRLTRPPAEIAIADIVVAVDESIKATRCEVGSGGCMVAAAPAACGEKCQTHDLWAELGRQIALFLGGLTLADVVDGTVLGRAARVSPLPAGRSE